MSNTRGQGPRTLGADVAQHNPVARQRDGPGSITIETAVRGPGVPEPQTSAPKARDMPMGLWYRGGGGRSGVNRERTAILALVEAFVLAA